MKKRIVASVAVVSVFVMAIAFATIAQAFPNKTSPCSNCHSTDTAVVVSATQTSNNGTTAAYSVSVNDAYGDGVTGWAVFDGSTNVANGYGPGTFSVAVGKTYRVFGVAGGGGVGSNSIAISPTAPTPTDTTAPTVSITSPAAGATVSGSVPVNATASDNVGVTKVDFRVDGTLLLSDTSSPYSATWDATTASAGSHTITATAYDAAGNNTVATRSVTIAPPADTTPPTVSITSPANGATVSGSVTINANAADAGGVATVEFYVDGVMISSDSSSPYSAAWNSAGAAVGTHAILAKAIDGAGNSASSSISVSIAPPPDTTAPTVSITSPANGATVSGSVPINATASDSVGVTRVEFYVDGTLILSDSSSPYSATWNSTGAAAGSHSIEARAFDAAGNRGTSTISVSIAPPPPPADTTAPSVSITSPANGATVSGSVAINATASDNVGVTRVEFYVDGTLILSDATSPYSATWNSTGAAAGTHAIEVRAYDAANNSSSASISVSIAPPPPPADTTAPSVTITAPTSGTTVSGQVPVAADATDNVSVTRVDFYVDGVLTGTDAAAPYTFLWDSSGATVGSHTIEARAYDAAGNVGTSSISLTIAPLPPAQTSVVTVSVTSGTASATSTFSGVKIVLRNTSTGVRYSGVTDSSGTVQFSGLPYGTYSMTASARGYKRATSKLVVNDPAETVPVILSAR